MKATTTIHNAKRTTDSLILKPQHHYTDTVSQAGFRFDNIAINNFSKPELTINRPGDKYEQEADAMADKIMRKEKSGYISSISGIPQVQRKCAHCEEEEKQVQRKESNAIPATANRNLNSYVSGLNNGGMPLPASVRSCYEPHFGYDFSQVRIHANNAAENSAQSINALAYTSGNHIVFNHGQYAPHTENGKRLLGHELTHVVQQRTIPGMIQRKGFQSTLEICNRQLKSRKFKVSQGGIKVTINARDDKRGSVPCNNEDFNVTLVDPGATSDDGYGNCSFEQKNPVSRTWAGLPKKEYQLVIWANNSNPYCCLVGEIEVQEQAGVTGESCTRYPPGPIEKLHNALDIAGLVPILGVVPDLINSGIYTIQGDWVNAGISAAAAVPVFGDGATVNKVGSKVVLQVEGDVIMRLGKGKMARELIEAKTAKTAKQAVEYTKEESLRASRDIGIEMQERYERQMLQESSGGLKVDPDIDKMVEKGIVEEAGVFEKAAKRPRPAAPAVKGSAERARDAFNGKVRDDYAKLLGVGKGGQVHHAIELQALDRYPGVFTELELNGLLNMRGIPAESLGKMQFHNSKIREVWDRHYRNLDSKIVSEGLVPGTKQYHAYVRAYLNEVRLEVDYTYGQFFTEYRTGLKK